MPFKHVVQQGECLSSIAGKYGLPDYRTIYNDPDNADFRKKRPDPNILYPGDVLVIPDLRNKTMACATQQRHKFKLKTAKRKIHVKLQDHAGRALKNLPYTLVVGKDRIEGTTTGAGEIKKEIPAQVDIVTIIMNGAQWPLHIAHLNPVRHTADEGISGLQSRLRNLGYSPGPIDGILGPRTQAAIRAFQRAHNLEPTGKVDDDFRNKLESEHCC